MEDGNAFLIKLGDVYYLTNALWKYDINTPGITEDQKNDCNAVAEEFARVKAQTGQSADTVIVKSVDLSTFQATPPGPPHLLPG